MLNIQISGHDILGSTVAELPLSASIRIHAEYLDLTLFEWLRFLRFGDRSISINYYVMTVCIGLVPD